MSPQKTANEDAISSLLCLSRDVRAHCSIGNSVRGKARLKSGTCQSPIAIFILVDVWCHQPDAKLKVPINRIATEVVAICEMVAHTLITKFLHVKRVILQVAAKDQHHFISFPPRQMTKVEDFF